MLKMIPEKGTTCSGENCNKEVAQNQFSLRMGDKEPIYFCSPKCASLRGHEEPVGCDFTPDWAIGQALAT